MGTGQSCYRDEVGLRVNLSVAVQCKRQAREILTVGKFTERREKRANHGGT